jgi:hypothetical protein
MNKQLIPVQNAWVKFQTPGSLAQVNIYQRRQNIIKSKQIPSESRKKPPLLAKCLRF